MVDISNIVKNNGMDNNNLDELYEKRIEICQNCGLYLETPKHPICNSKKYISLLDKETISDTPKANFVKGCSCNLELKAKRSFSRCIAGKW